MFSLTKKITAHFIPNQRTSRNLSSIIFAIFLSVSLLRFNFPAHISVSIFLLVIGLFCLIYFLVRSNIKILLLLFLLIFSCISVAYLNNNQIRIVQHLSFILMCYGIALLMLKGKVKAWAAKVPHYITCIYFLLCILYNINPNDTVFASRNTVSMMLLVCTVSYYFLSRDGKNLFPAILTFYLSIWAIGRAGIISSGVLVVGLAFYQYKVGGPQKFQNLVIFIVTLTTLLYYLFFPYLNTNNFNFFNVIPLFNNKILLEIPAFENYYYKYINNVGISGRLEIWENYINHIHLKEFFIGINIYELPWKEGEAYMFNTHNSFIALHSRMGITGVFLFIFLIFLVFFYFYRGEIINSLLLVVILLRWFFDEGLFFESWDFIVYYLIIRFFTFHNMKTRRIFPNSAKLSRFS